MLFDASCCEQPRVAPPTPKRPGIFDDESQSPNEDLEMFVETPRHDPSDPRQLLLALIEDQHDQLHAHITKNRKALMEHICRSTWPCRLAPGDAIFGRAPPDKSHPGQTDTVHNSSGGCDPPLPAESVREPVDRALEATERDVGPAIGDQTGSRTDPNEGGHSTNAAGIRRHLSGLVGDGLFRKPGQKFNSTLDLAVCMVVVANALAIIVETQWHGYKAAVALGLSEENQWHGASLWFDVLEHLFAAVFIVELVTRIWMQKLKYFGDTANLFDLFLVLFSVMELYILTPLGEASGMNFMMLRLSRLCKVMRVFRVIRVMRLFLSLHIIVSTIIHCVGALFWSMFVLLLVILLGGLIMSQILADYIMDDENPLDTRKWVYHYYGGSARATLTMFEVTMSGCWPNYSRRLIEEVSVFFAIFFTVYIAGVVFAITRIISALFLKHTLDSSKLESDRVLAELKQKRDTLVRQLTDFFTEADQSGDGLVDRDEFEEMLKNPNVRMWLSSLDLHVHEYVGLFNLIDNGSGFVSFKEFLIAVQRLKGNARSLDMISITLDLTKLKHKVEEVRMALWKLSGTAPISSLTGLEGESRDVHKAVVTHLVETSGSSRWFRD